MAEKANDEVKNIPSEPIAKWPTLPESLTELKEDLGEKDPEEMSETLELPEPTIDLVQRRKELVTPEELEALKREYTPSETDQSVPKIKDWESSKDELESIEKLKLISSQDADFSIDSEYIDLVQKSKAKFRDMDKKAHERMTKAMESPKPFSAKFRYMDKKAHERMTGAIESPKPYSVWMTLQRGWEYIKDFGKKMKGEDDEVFLCARSLKAITELIKSGKLPSQKILDEMCQIYEKKSQEIIITCEAICKHIKSKHAAIANVWAAYTIQNPHKITFVVMVEHKSEGDTSTETLSLDKLITYSFVKQQVGEFSSEGPEVLRQETSASEGLDEESYQKLQSCISRHSEDLMKRHKYLSIISACSNRSRGFGASWNLLPEKCIVLYVQKKSYIPIDEEPFETHYDGIPVDVREGAFIPFGRTAKDLLDPVKMGSQIGGDNYKGTLGFFIDHPQFGICGLTCAHVLLTRWEMIELKTNHSGTLKWPLHRMCKNVYQPADKQSVLGHTVQLIYKEGSDENCGMELALFRITDRHPKSPSFPDVTGSNVATSIIYDSWRMCSTDRLNKKEDAHVIKFGSNTELSYGIIKFDTISVKSLDAYPLVHEYAPIQLFKQIEVQALSNGTPFAKEGDSGAPVFVVEKNSQNKCIGIIEGGTTYGTVVVTPIVPILAELDVPCLKSFDTEKELSNIQNKMDNLETQMKKIGSDIQTIKQILLKPPHNFDSSMTNSPNDQQGHA